MKRIAWHSRPKWVHFAIMAVIGLSACAGAGTASSNTPVPTLAPVTPVKGPAVVIVDVAPLRSGPGVEFEPVGVLAEGEIVTLVGSSPAKDWYRVTLPTPQGGINEAWVSAEFIAPIRPTSTPLPSWTPSAMPSPTSTRKPTSTLVPPATPTDTPTAAGTRTRTRAATPTLVSPATPTPTPIAEPATDTPTLVPPATPTDIPIEPTVAPPRRL